MKPCVPLRLAEYGIKSQPSDFINEIDGCKIVTCVDRDQVDQSPQDRHMSIAARLSNASRAATSPVNSEGAISPTRRKRTEKDGYKT